MQTLIQNANIFTQDFNFHKGSLKIINGIITDISADSFTDSSQDISEIIDAENLYVIPGLTDIHFHGCNGHDFCEATLQAFNAIADYEIRNGITTICPATMTLPHEKLFHIMKAAKSFKNLCPNFAGIYLEGPFISPEKTGAQNPAYVARPSIEILKELHEESGGLIKIAVVAPEVDGALQFIENAHKFLRVSIAHTTCTYEIAVDAFKSGACQVTHLYNAMNPINHRAPGPVIAAVENENVNVELICDGIHVHPAVVRNTLRMFGDDRVIFISDSMEATGMPDGNYMLGGLKVLKHGNTAVLEDGKTIAGSVTNLMDCMKISVLEMNVPLESAVKCAAINSARAIGIDVSISAGKIADLVLMDKNLNLVCVINHGTVIRN